MTEKRHDTHAMADQAGAGTDRGWNTPRLRRALGMGLGTGVASAFPIWKVPRKRLTVVSGIVAAAVTTAGVVLVRDQAEREAEVQGEPRPTSGAARRIAAPVLTGALVGGVVAGSMWLTSVADEWTEKGLAKLGAKRPRATYAVLAGVGAAVLEYFDSAFKPVAATSAKPSAEKA